MADRYAPGDSDAPVSVPTFAEVSRQLRASLKRAGLPHDTDTVKREASAYFARLLAPPATRGRRDR